MRASTLKTLALLAALAPAAPARAAEPVTLTDLSKPSAPGKTFLATTTIAAPMSGLCAILGDYARYPGFMPNTEKAQVVQSGAGFAVVDMTLKLPMGKIKRYRLRMEPAVSAQSCRLSWTMLPRPDLKPEETIADTKGFWLLTPLPGNAKATAVKYQVYTDPGPVPLGLGWIVDSLSKDSLPKTLEALRARAGAR